MPRTMYEKNKLQSHLSRLIEAVGTIVDKYSSDVVVDESMTLMAMRRDLYILQSILNEIERGGDETF